MSTETKYQIFVSSTFTDLVEERNEVIKVILKMGHIPVGMEMFNAADSEQWKIIQRQINECDYYVVIIAHRYGATVNKVSYTEKEYDYATSNGVPTLGFVIDDKVAWEPQKVEQSSENKKRLLKFKNKIKGKMVNFWSSKEHLAGLIAISLSEQFKISPRTGWIRSDQGITPQISTELSRLSEQNSKLTERLEKVRNLLRKELSEDYKEAMIILKNYNYPISFKYDDSTEWENSKECSLEEIFMIMAPEIRMQKSIGSLAYLLAFILDSNNDKEPREDDPIPVNTLNSIIADLIVLNLIKLHQYEKITPYLSLTDKGEDIYKIIRKTELTSKFSSNSNEDK